MQQHRSQGVSYSYKRMKNVTVKCYLNYINRGQLRHQMGAQEN